MTANTMRGWLERKATNVESGIMTVVGVEMTLENECIHCQKERDPWARCVVVEGENGKGLACNNCHQLCRGSKCEKYVPPDTGTAEEPLRRQRQARAPQVD